MRTSNLERIEALRDYIKSNITNKTRNDDRDIFIGTLRPFRVLDEKGKANIVYKRN